MTPYSAMNRQSGLKVERSLAVGTGIPSVALGGTLELHMYDLEEIATISVHPRTQPRYQKKTH